jgi:hypothetical protein
VYRPPSPWKNGDIIEILSSSDEVENRSLDQDDEWGDAAVLTWVGYADVDVHVHADVRADVADGDTLADIRAPSPYAISSGDDWGADACLEWDGESAPQDEDEDEDEDDEEPSSDEERGEWHDIDAVDDEDDDDDADGISGHEDATEALPDYASWEIAKLQVCH